MVNLLTIAALVIGFSALIFSYFAQLRPDLAYFESLGIREQLEAKHPPEIIGDFITYFSFFTLALLIPAALALIFRWGNPLPPLIVLASNGLLAAGILGAEISANWESAMVSSIGKDPSELAYLVKLLLIFITSLSPAIVFVYYRTCSTMDRYTLRNFGFPFLLCYFSEILFRLFFFP